MPRFSPDEDAALMPYVACVADWETVAALLPRRSLWGARNRLKRLRRYAGTLWTIDQRDKARSQPRIGGKFA